MVDKLENISKVIKIGNSLGLTISKDIVDILNLKPGDYLQVSFKKVEKEKK